MSFSVTPIGIILILGLIALFYKDFFREKHLATANGESFDFKKSLKKFYIDNFFCFVCIALFTNLGYIVKINSFEVGLTTPFFTIVWLISLYYIFFEKKFNKKIIILGSIIAVIDILAVVLYVAFPYKGGIIPDNASWDLYLSGQDVKVYSFSFEFIQFKYIFTLFKFTVTLATVACIMRDSDIWFKLLNIIVKASYVVFIYGLIEIIFLKVFNFSTTKSIINFLFSENPVIDYVSQGRFQGIYKEPSHYCLNLFFISVFIILYLIKNKNSLSVKNQVIMYVLFVLNLLLMVLSRAFSAVIFVPLAVLLLVWYLLPAGHKLPCILAIIGIVSFAVSFVLNKSVADALGLGSLNEKLTGVFDAIIRLVSGKKAIVSSEGNRMTSIFESLKLLFYRPWGVGLGNTDAHSSFFSLLVSLGILGAPLHIYMILKFGNFSKKSLMFGIIIFISVLFVGGVGYFASIIYPVLFYICYLVLPEPKNKKLKKDVNCEKE